MRETSENRGSRYCSEIGGMYCHCLLEMYTSDIKKVLSYFALFDKIKLYSSEDNACRHVCTYISVINVSYVYYMCETNEIHLWCLGCIIHILHAAVIHVYILHILYYR